MEKKVYMKPLVEALPMETAQVMCVSPVDTRIKSSRSDTDMGLSFGGTDDEGMLDPD